MFYIDFYLQNEPNFIGATRFAFAVNAVEIQKIRMFGKITKNAVFIINYVPFIDVIRLDFNGNSFAICLFVNGLVDLFWGEC